MNILFKTAWLAVAMVAATQVGAQVTLPLTLPAELTLFEHEGCGGRVSSTDCHINVNTRVNARGLTTGLVPGVSALDTTTDEKDTDYKLFGRYQFNRNIALEGGYFNLGKSSFTANTSPAGTLAGETKVHGINLDLVGTLPLTERLSALGRIGAQHLQWHWGRSGGQR